LNGNVVDDDYEGRRVGILFREGTATQQRNAQPRHFGGGQTHEHTHAGEGQEDA
jgi:hypothetical protein